MRPLFHRSAALLVAALLATPAAAQTQTLSLDAVLTRAWEEAPAVASAKAQAYVARTRIDVAAAPALPSLSASIDTGATVTNDNALLPCSGLACGKGFGATANAGAGVDARWLLLDFGRTSEGVRSARLSHDAAEADVNAVRNDAAVAAGTSFLALAGDLELIDARKKLVGERQRLLDVAKGRVQSGLASPIEETRAQVALETAKVDVTSADAAAADDAASLAIALGLDPARPLRIAPPGALAVADDPAQAADLAEQSRAEVQSLKLRVDAAEAASMSARAARMPAVSATAGAGTDLVGTVLPGATAGESVGVGASLTVPIFDAGISAQIASADAEALVARAAYRQEVLAIRGEAAQAAIAVRSFDAALRAAEQLQTQADENYRQASGRYEAGAAGLLELIDAETQQSDALLSVIGARFRLEGAKLRLMAATGVLKR